MRGQTTCAAERICHLGRAYDIHSGVAARLIQRLCRASLGREMDDDIGGDTGEEGIPGMGISDVTNDQLDLVGKVGGRKRALVHLGMQRVQNNPALCAIRKLRGQRSADESCSTSDQYCSYIHYSVFTFRCMCGASARLNQKRQPRPGPSL